MPENVDEQSGGNESTHSLDNELGGFNVPMMRTPGVKKAIDTTNENLCHSTQEKNLISRFGYNDYMAQHYAFMMKVASAQEPECFSAAARDP